MCMLFGLILHFEVAVYIRLNASLPCLYPNTIYVKLERVLLLTNSGSNGPQLCDGINDEEESRRMREGFT